VSEGSTRAPDVNIRRALLVAALVALLLMPFFIRPYWNGQFSLVLVYAVAALGLNLLTGYNGQISLGHGAFFALGAYIAAILVDRTAIPWPLTIPIAAVVAFAAGFAFGGPALRLRGLYLALVTLGLSIAAPLVIKRFGDLTGGTQGMDVPMPSAPGWLPLADDQFRYFVALVVAVPLFAVAWNLVRRQTGRAIVTVRDSELVAGAFGINPATVKMRVFGVSAMYAGTAGATYVFLVGYISPDDVTIMLSLAFVTAVIIGGVSTISGALFGALFVRLVPLYASEVNDVLTGVVYGTTLIVVMYAMPGGIAGAAGAAWRRLDRLRTGPAAGTRGEERA
jgi:branched-chain amino acid transport system permease protein